MEIPSIIFKHHVSNFKHLLNNLFEYDKLGTMERGWEKQHGTINEFRIESQDIANFMGKITKKPVIKVSKEPVLYKYWEYGILHNDSVVNPFLSNVLVIKNGNSFKVYSVNVGYTKKAFNEMGFYYNKKQFPTIKQVVTDYADGNFMKYNSLITNNNELQAFNDYTDRLSCYNWLNTVIKLYLNMEEMKDIN